MPCTGHGKYTLIPIQKILREKKNLIERNSEKNIENLSLPRLEKRSQLPGGWRLSAVMCARWKTPLETLAPSQHYRIEGFKGSL